MFYELFQAHKSSSNNNDDDMEKKKKKRKKKKHLGIDLNGAAPEWAR